jgi:hypothetical protein
LASLSAYVNASSSAAIVPQPSGWTVTRHAAGSSYWLELRAAEPAALPALLSCGHVSTGSPQEISAAGYGSVPPPALNYAPALGLYLARPERPGRPGM